MVLIESQTNHLISKRFNTSQSHQIINVANQTFIGLPFSGEKNETRYIEI
jgi:hypothetical protein